MTCRGGHITFFFSLFSLLDLLSTILQLLCGRSTCTTLFNISPFQMGLDSNQPSLPVLCGPQVGSSWVADRFLQSVGWRESLPWNLALSRQRGWVGAQRLGGADEQGSRLRGVLLWARQSMSRTGPLRTVCGRGGVVDELGNVGLRWGGGSRRVAQGALARS